jgi:hypothetical protein
MTEPTEITRRGFAKAAVAAVAVPILAPLAACTPTPPAESPAPAPAEPAATTSAAPQGTPGEKQPSPLARALTDAVRVQYGDRMNDEQMAKVGRSIAGGLDTAERLRRYPLSISAEPSFVYRVPGGPAR